MLWRDVKAWQQETATAERGAGVHPWHHRAHTNKCADATPADLRGEKLRSTFYFVLKATFERLLPVSRFIFLQRLVI